MRVLIACETSGESRRAFAARGHDAYSVDLLPAADGSARHLQGDALPIIACGGWDLIIAHPPCKYLACSGNRWHSGSDERAAAVEWTRALWEACCAAAPRVALENPVGVLSSEWRAPDQYVHPWQHGHGETKRTGLWLRGLPLLTPSDTVAGREARCHRMPPSADRWQRRSATYPGIAAAFADQWGGALNQCTVNNERSIKYTF